MRERMLRLMWLTVVASAALASSGCLYISVERSAEPKSPAAHQTAGDKAGDTPNVKVGGDVSVEAGHVDSH